MSSETHKTPTSLRIGAVIVGVVLLGVLIVGITARAQNARTLKSWTEEQASISVSVINATEITGGKPLELPGRFEAYAAAPLYARVSGYLKSWKADIGTPVKTGQLIAEIETPDLDQQLLQARAEVATAKANVDLAAITAKRLQSLLDTNSVSHQEVDEKVGDYAAKQALLQSSQANLDRLVATKAFARIVAPFDGVVTSRNTDTGALINVGSGTGPALFVVSDNRRLRLYVSVPQAYLGSIKPGDMADVTVPEQPGQVFQAKVVSASQSVDAGSGTSLMQLSLNNADGKLLPGSYARVSFNLQGQASRLSIPASALIFDAKGMQVAVVDGDGSVKRKAITVARDMGSSLELSDGISATDRIIDNPPDGIADGTKVLIKQDTPAAEKKAG
ncbi:MAG TPA: efflux RND transporter periplasmic adaptor subunit [Methylovorus sp.]|nr:efflux RND transporter periplasmic adaptor subunit [Methylovorus sp.]